MKGCITCFHIWIFWSRLLNHSWLFYWLSYIRKLINRSLASCDPKFAPWFGNCLFWFAIKTSKEGKALDWFSDKLNFQNPLACSYLAICKLHCTCKSFVYTLTWPYSAYSFILCQGCGHSTLFKDEEDDNRLRMLNTDRSRRTNLDGLSCSVSLNNSWYIGCHGEKLPLKENIKFFCLQLQGGSYHIQVILQRESNILYLYIIILPVGS